MITLFSMSAGESKLCQIMVDMLYHVVLVLKVDTVLNYLVLNRPIVTMEKAILELMLLSAKKIFGNH